MKQKKIVSVFAMAIVLGALQGQGVFATNKYDINYTGGEPLGSSNVQVKPAVVNGLSRIVHGKTSTTFSNSARWQDGYLKLPNTCMHVKYLLIDNTNQISASDKIGYSVTNGNYTMDVSLTEIIGENLNNILTDGKYVIASVAEGSGFIYAGGFPYGDSTCSDASAVLNVEHLKHDDGANLFINANIKLTNNYTGKTVSSNGLYYELGDIDGSQSFKILNAGNELSQNNMYVASAEALQPTGDTNKNMYVSSGKYIYSQGNFGINDGNDIFVKISSNTQNDGLDIVYGFAHPAGSSIGYYAKLFNAKYISDQHGKITGITEESIIDDNSPLGSTVEASTGYRFDHWIASADIKLEDGTTVAAGQPISTAQLVKAKLTTDTVFTAIQVAESDVKVPNTGESTKTTETITAISLSAFGVLLIALFIRALPRINRNKVKFD